jgi:hypothetical protein
MWVINRYRKLIVFGNMTVNAIVGTVLCAQAFLLGLASYVDSPTLNEPGHLASGLSIWKLDRFDVFRVHPPLVHMIAAVPVVVTGVQTDWHSFSEGAGARPEFNVGEDLIAANGVQSVWLMTLARWACIPFSLIGGYFCYRWATDLYGAAAGITALVLWCFCPNILAHGHLITTDAAATSLGLCAVYSLWKWLRQPTWSRAFLCGIILGIAELTKTTLLLLYLLWPALWLMYRWSGRKDNGVRDWKRESAMLAIQLLISVFVINLGYGFDGSFTRLADYQFVSDSLTPTKEPHARYPIPGNIFAGTWAGNLPVPLPREYVRGIDLQKLNFEHFKRPSYLNGEFKAGGWWYYYLYGLLIKVPLGTWLLLVLAIFVRLRGQVAAKLRDELVLLLPAIGILAFVSSQIGFNAHLRYVLPVLPFMFVWISAAALTVNRAHIISTVFFISASAWSIVSSLLVYPHSLSYFNELAGGPTGGAAHLINSNIDWGQDLLFLQDWLKKHPEAKPLKLAYYGYFAPKSLCIEHTLPENIPSDAEFKAGQKIPPGWYAISVSFVEGMPFSVYKGDGSRVEVPQYALSVFKNLKPVAMAGYSIYIYHIIDELNRPMNN